MTTQETNFKFLDRLGKTTTQTLRVLQDVYGDDTMSRGRALEWHRRLRMEDVEDDPRCGRPATSRAEENIELVRRKVHGDCCLTFRMIAKELEMNCKRVWTIITKYLVKKGRSVQK